MMNGGIWRTLLFSRGHLNTTRLCRSASYRSFCNVGPNRLTQSITDVPLSKPVPWLKAPKYASPSDKPSETQVTTLDNGLRVASENMFGEFCTLGVLIDSGSRYETGYPSGISHYLEKLAFGKTEKFNSKDEILQLLEDSSGICDCQGSRDHLIYAVSANCKTLSAMGELLSEVVLKPNISESELMDAAQAIHYDLEMLAIQPDPDPILLELTNLAAYQNNTLGLPRICPAENIQKITRSELYTYLHHHHTPDRMVLAGVSVDHQQLVEVAQRYFTNKPSWQTATDVAIDTARTTDRSPAQYTGGVYSVEKDLSNVSLGPNPMPHLAHIVIGLESCSHQDPDFVAFCVLNMMMGGGGSFSAGGPGKGMYTRLYINVLNRQHWIHNATAYNHAYKDTGVFAIHGSAPPEQLKDLVEVLTQEIVNVQHSISPPELERAKTQLQSMLMMNLESRPVVFEDVGRQVLACNYRHQPEHYFELIGKITSADIQRVCKRMLQSTPTLAAYGELNMLPSFDDVQSALSSRTGSLPKKFSLFT